MGIAQYEPIFLQNHQAKCQTIYQVSSKFGVVVSEKNGNKGFIYRICFQKGNKKEYISTFQYQNHGFKIQDMCMNTLIIDRAVI